MRIAIVEDDERFLACLPFQHVRSGLRTISAVSYQVATSRLRRMNYLGTPLLDPTGGLEAVVKLLETIAEECRSEGSYAAELWDVAAGGAADTYLHEAAASLGLPLVLTDSFDRGILRQGDDAGKQQLRSAQAMRDLGKKQRRLARALGSEAVLVDRSDDDAIEEYIRLEAAGYKAESGVAMSMFLGEPEYFTEMCRAFAADGRLHVFSLVSGSTTTAMSVLIDAGDSIFMCKASYDTDFARYSPGLQIHAAIIGQFQNTSAAMLDTCTGKNNEFISSIYPSRRTVNQYRLVVHDRLRDRMWVRFVDEARGTRARFGKLASATRTPPQGFRAPGS
jgi:CelD/BcsL family acetyltransferase involved in cellulose biosynthesis